MPTSIICLQALSDSVVDVSLSVDGNDILPMILSLIFPDPAMYPLPTSSLSSGCSIEEEGLPPTINDDVTVPPTINDDVTVPPTINDDVTVPPTINDDVTVHTDDSSTPLLTVQKAGSIHASNSAVNGTPPGLDSIYPATIKTVVNGPAPAVNNKPTSLPTVNGISPTQRHCISD